MWGSVAGCIMVCQSCRTLGVICFSNESQLLETEFFRFLQAPAVDVVAVGLVSGHIIVHNIKFDETLMKFQQDWGPITAISFRTGTS